MMESHDGPLPPDFGRGWLAQNPAHHVLVDLQAEDQGDLLGDARATKARIEAFDLENSSYQLL